MAGSLTLGIVKPDAVAGGKAGEDHRPPGAGGLQHRARSAWSDCPPQARRLLRGAQGRPFYDDLVEFMTSGPCLPMALERTDAVAELRTVIGATDPAEAAPGTIRKLYAESKGRNAIHASDSDENAAREVAFFFSEGERAGSGRPCLDPSRCPGYFNGLCCEWTSGTSSGGR